MADSTDDPRPTIVLLGASNLTRGISTVVGTLRLQHEGGPPLRIVTALGHGRSYGTRSSVLGRSLCSVLDCGLWTAMAESSATFGLLTDIGNDIMYGVPPLQIIVWLEACIDRLSRAGIQRIHITALPMDSIRRVKPWQYAIVKSILFPTHDIDFETAVTRAIETQHLLEQLVARRAPLVKMIDHEGGWYGFDPIHIRAKHWPAAWARFLAREDAQADLRARGSFARWRRLRLHMPAEYEILGRQRRRTQPLRLADGTTIEMY